MSEYDRLKKIRDEARERAEKAQAAVRAADTEHVRAKEALASAERALREERERVEAQSRGG